MVPASTARAPSHSTSVTAPNVIMMAAAISQARTRVRWIAVSKLSSTAVS
jgi:hypothetical protein